MGYDATSGEGNTTGQAYQTQALSFAGSTSKPRKPLKIELLDSNSRDCGDLPHTVPNGRNLPGQRLQIPNYYHARSLSGHIARLSVGDSGALSAALTGADCRN